MAKLVRTNRGMRGLDPRAAVAVCEWRGATDVAQTAEWRAEERGEMEMGGNRGMEEGQTEMRPPQAARITRRQKERRGGGGQTHPPHEHAEVSGKKYLTCT
eukprot:scaffold159178_cov35-Tisochrysis_lutea.AAC.1